MTNVDYFADIVGQEDVKRKLSFYVDGYQKTSMIPHFMFVAERGCGKTTAAIEIAKHLTIDGKPKRAKEINCSTLKSVSQFVEQVLMPFVQDNDCTILFDEPASAPRISSAVVRPEGIVKNVYIRCIIVSLFESAEI